MRRSALKQARVEKGLSQIRAAEVFGVTVDHIRSLEYGRVNPGLKLMFAMCSFYKKTHEDLFPDITNGILNTTIV